MSPLVLPLRDSDPLEDIGATTPQIPSGRIPSSVGVAPFGGGETQSTTSQLEESIKTILHRPEFTPLTKVTKMPLFKEQVSPTYPTLAKRSEKEGTVILEVGITETGRVLETKVIQGLGFGFDEAAQEAILKSTFEPAYVGDKAVAVVVQIPIKFRFRD